MKDFPLAGAAAPPARPERDVTATGPLPATATGATAAAAPSAPASTPVRDVLAAESASAAPFPVTGALGVASSEVRPAAAGPRAPGAAAGPTGPTGAAASGESVNFTANPEARRRLLAGAPQSNAISNATSPPKGPDTCGGAAMMSAMVMSSDTPAKAAANANAIAGVAQQFGRTLSAEESAALERFRSGTCTPADIQRLQVLMYDLGRMLCPPGGQATRMNPEMMGGLVAAMRENGAVGLDNARFSMVDPGHWICTYTTPQDGTPNGLQTTTIDTDAPGSTVAVTSGRPEKTLPGRSGYEGSVTSQGDNIIVQGVTTAPPPNGNDYVERQTMTVAHPPRSLDQMRKHMADRNRAATATTLLSIVTETPQWGAPVVPRRTDHVT